MSPSRRARSYYEGEVQKHRERQAPAPDAVVRRRSKKNTRKWCRGKEGVPHTPEMVRHHYYVPPLFTKPCHWYPKYGIVAGKRVVISEKWHYTCYHAIRCSTCGKYLETYLGEEKCPDARQAD